MIHKMMKIRGADFCDDQFPIISPLGRGPKNESEEIDEAIRELLSPAKESLELVYAGVIPEISSTSFHLFKIPLSTPISQISTYDISDFSDWRTELSNHKSPIMFVNGPLNGIEISNGTILRNNTSGNYWTLLGVKDGLPICIDQPPVGNRYVASYLVDDGWTFCASGFAQFIDDGNEVDYPLRYSTCYNYVSSLTAVGQRTVIGWDSDNWYVFVSPGRMPYDIGFDYEALYNVFSLFGIPNGVNLDGGGSTQCYLNNPLFEITQVAENTASSNSNSLKTRNVPFMIVFGDDDV